VTNSVRHGCLAPGDSIAVSVEIANGTVRLQVEDPGGDAVVSPREPDRERGGGFGLFVVGAVAERWGATHERGTCVWAELALSPVN
jgi:two-component sensor histidine kinase